jgi:hypothetical protein
MLVAKSVSPVLLSVGVAIIVLFVVVDAPSMRIVVVLPSVITALSVCDNVCGFSEGIAPSAAA